MKKVKILLIVCIVAVLALTLSVIPGCKTTTPTTAAAAETTAAETTAAAATTAAAETTAAETTAAETGVVLSLLHDKGGNPNYQPYYVEMGKEAEKLFGIKIEPSPYPTTDVFIATVKAALPTKDAPDLFTWWSTYRMKELIDQNLVAETSDLWQKHKDEYPKGVMDAFTFNGKQYGYPYLQDYWIVYYNKDVFSKLGLSEPKTWDEFIKVCETLKSNKVTPMVQTVQARWPSFIMFEQFVIGEDPQLYVDLCNGKVKYSDPKVKAAFEVWKSLIDKGYFTDPGIDYFNDTASMFNKGEVGMIPGGTWYYQTVLLAGGVPEEKIGAFIMPPQKESAGKNIILEVSPILISKNAPHLADALKVVDYFMGPEGNQLVARLNKSYPCNMKSATDYLPDLKVKIANTVKNENYNILNRYWEATPTPICEAAVDKFAEFITNPNSLDKVLSDLDKIADKYWSENQ
ncbi:MAG: ABC transporter substrate-binding protein [Candidatus Humimicrobiaceae bacterium]